MFPSNDVDDGAFNEPVAQRQLRKDCAKIGTVETITNIGNARGTLLSVLDSLVESDAHIRETAHKCSIECVTKMTGQLVDSIRIVEQIVELGVLQQIVELGVVRGEIESGQTITT